MPISGMARPLPLAAAHVGDHARHVGAQGEHDQVVHRAVVVAGLGLRDVALSGARSSCSSIFGFGTFSHDVEPLGAHLHLAHRASGIRRACVRSSPPRLRAQRLGVVEHRVEHAVAAVEPAALRVDAARFGAEQPVEDVAAGCLRPAAARRRATSRAWWSPRRDRKLERAESRLRRGDLGHQLVARDGVAEARRPSWLIFAAVSQILPHSCAWPMPLG